MSQVTLNTPLKGQTIDIVNVCSKAVVSLALQIISRIPIVAACAMFGGHGSNKLSGYGITSIVQQLSRVGIGQIEAAFFRTPKNNWQSVIIGSFLANASTTFLASYVTSFAAKKYPELFSNAKQREIKMDKLDFAAIFALSTGLELLFTTVKAIAQPYFNRN